MDAVTACRNADLRIMLADAIHRAALNFGDCMSYAVAKAKDVPLLFKGDDFRLTDISVLP